MILTALIATLPLASAQQHEIYRGRYAEHPNLPALIEVLDATLEDADDVLPRWLSKKTPRASYVLIDLEEAQERLWPCDVRGSVSWEGSKGGAIFTVEVPVDPLIGDPRLGHSSLARKLFHCALLSAAGDAGVSWDRLGDYSPDNPVLGAMSSFLAGDLTAELEYTLSRHLDSDAALDAVFADIVEPADGTRWRFEDRPEDDVTFLVLALYLTPKGKDKKLGELFKAFNRGQPVEGALKKPTRKKLDKLNPELRKTYDAFLEERFPGEDREAYRRIARARDAGEWAEVLTAAEAFLEQRAGSLGAPNAAWLRARALVELDPEAAPEALAQVLSEYRNRTPYAWEAQLQLALLAKKAGEVKAARSELERLDLEFGWMASARERAEKERRAL